MRDVYVLGIGLDSRSSAPVLLLQEFGGAQRVLPISIGELPDEPPDVGLIAQLVERFGERLSRVSITVFDRDALHGELIFNDGDRVGVRAGDAVLLAVHLAVPIQVADVVLARVGVARGGVVDATGMRPADHTDEIRRFRRALDTARAEDFR